MPRVRLRSGRWAVISRSPPHIRRQMPFLTHWLTEDGVAFLRPQSKDGSMEGLKISVPTLLHMIKEGMTGDVGAPADQTPELFPSPPEPVIQVAAVESQPAAMVQCRQCGNLLPAAANF